MNKRLLDENFVGIVTILPTSCLEVLDVEKTYIEAEGILAFAAQLPRIKSLKKVNIAHNPWEGELDFYRNPQPTIAHPPEYEECIAALLQASLENDSIESLRTLRSYNELEYCTHPNWLKNEILATHEPIPLELWPLLLEKVGKRKWHPRWHEDLRFPKYSANAIYFVLRNSPILSYFRSSPAL